MQARSAGVTAADRRRAVPGVTLGRQPAVRRRVLRRSCQSGRARLPRVLAPARRAGRPLFRPPDALSRAGHAPAGARRAPRALEDVGIVITTLDNTRCQRSDCDLFPLVRWQTGRHRWPGEAGQQMLSVPSDP